MSELVIALRKQLELTAELAEERYGHNSMSSMAEGSWKPVGAYEHNRDLKPLLEKVLKVIERVDSDCGHTCDLCKEEAMEDLRLCLKEYSE